jgi:hypothetical protein
VVTVQGDGVSGPAREPDEDRLRRIWAQASPAWRLELPPYDPDAALLDLETAEGFEDG